MERFILAAAVGMSLATLTPERGAATALPQVSAGTTSLRVHVQIFNRCTRLWRRCSRGNDQACKLYRAECQGVRPIYTEDSQS